MTQDPLHRLQADISERRVQVHAWVAQQMMPLLMRGVKLAKEEGEPRELRQWVEVLARLAGFNAERDTQAQSNLAVVSISFQNGGIQAAPVVVDVRAKEVPSAVSAALMETIPAPSPGPQPAAAPNLPDIETLLGVETSNA